MMVHSNKIFKGSQRYRKERAVLLGLAIDLGSTTVAAYLTMLDNGEVVAGHSATALYAVTFRPNADGRIATVQLRWEDPDNHQITEINGNFNTWDLAASFEQADLRYQLAVVVAQYAEILRNSPWATGTYPSSLVDHAYRLSSLLWDDPDVVEFASLVSRASQIKALGN
jgi:Ca-activated chloride channel family protein